MPTLRLYRWAPATLSLGYFQSWEHRQLHSASLICDCIRRASGGGAILHDHEITYSLVLPTSNRWSTRNNQIYNLVHNAIAQVFLHWGIELIPFSTSSMETTADNPFLCFLRRSDGDLIFNGHKVVGSAQRRSRNALLQHGSILLKKSRFAPELSGISDLQAVNFSEQEIWRQSLSVDR